MRSYVGLNAADLDDAVVALSNVLAQQIPELNRKFGLNRPLSQAVPTDGFGRMLVNSELATRNFSDDER
jgi:hypothetical protein